MVQRWCFILQMMRNHSRILSEACCDLFYAFKRLLCLCREQAGMEAACYGHPGGEDRGLGKVAPTAGPTDCGQWAPAVKSLDEQPVPRVSAEHSWSLFPEPTPG